MIVFQTAIAQWPVVVKIDKTIREWMSSAEEKTDVGKA